MRSRSSTTRPLVESVVPQLRERACQSLSKSHVAALLGLRALESLEQIAQHGQGKGWAARSVRPEVAAMHGLLGAVPSDPLVILDVGANVGNWTEVALDAFPAARIYAFEPSASIHATLSERFANERRVSVQPFALGARDGDAVLYAPAPDTRIGSLTRREIPGMSFSIEEPISIRTLDGWAGSAGVDAIDAIKLDVEGHELDVLNSGPEILERVRVVQFEFGGCNIDTRTYFRDFWSLFSERGFRLHRLGPRGLSELTRYREHDEVFRTTNWFASR